MSDTSIVFNFPPCEHSGGEHHRATFMITSRIAKKGRGVRGVVKKSAKFAVLDTNGIVMSCSSTRSRTKKCRRSMCFDRYWCSGLYARSLADLLSVWSDVGSVGGSPRSSKRVRKYTASFAASDAAIISVSQDERATQGYFFEDQEMATWLYMKMYPEV
eukprot:3362512-Pleurochrysis_carterae.AAC.1